MDEKLPNLHFYIFTLEALIIDINKKWNFYLSVLC